MTTVTVPADELEVAGLDLARGSHRFSFTDHGAAQVTVVRRAGAAAVAVTTDASAPTSEGPWRWTIPAGEVPATVVVPVPVVGEAVVRLHAEGPVTVDVRPF